MEGKPQINHNLPIPTHTEELQHLLLKAQEGDRSILPQLKQVLDANPDLWQQVGDLAQHAELTMLNLVAGNDLFAREAIQRKVAELKAEWTNPSPAPLEKLLVDRVAVCWLQLHYLDVDAFQTLAQDPGKTPASVYAQRRLDSAQRRYLQAIRALATVRKLLPAVPSPMQIAEHLQTNGAMAQKAHLRGKSIEGQLARQG
jgi:hypothetical protein